MPLAILPPRSRVLLSQASENSPCDKELSSRKMRVHHFAVLSASLGLAHANCARPSNSTDTFSSTSSSIYSVVSGSSTTTSSATSSSIAVYSSQSTSSTEGISSLTTTGDSSTTISSTSTSTTDGTSSSITDGTSSSTAASSSSTPISSDSTSSNSGTSTSTTDSTISSTASTSDSTSSSDGISTSTTDGTSSSTTDGTISSTASTSDSTSSSDGISTSTTDGTSSSTTATSDSTSSSSTSISSSSQSTTSTLPQPTQICQSYGTLPQDVVPLSSSTSVADDTFRGCQQLCQANTACNSFSIQIMTGGACTLYASPLYLDLTVGTSGPTVYFDVGCPEPNVTGPSISPLTTATDLPAAPTGVDPVYVVPAFTTGTITSSDSPDYTAPPTPTPTNDNDFISTYTYNDFTMTLNSTGFPPATNGIPHPTGTDIPVLPCMVTAGPDATFTVLNPQYIPMVSRTGSVGPLLQPTEAPAAGDPLLDPQNLVLPPFYLQAAAGVSDVYDMVYQQTGEFVALGPLGAVVLVSGSTGTAGDGEYVTTIFSIDCIGEITISYGGADYTWTTDGQSCSILPGTPSVANTMKALPAASHAGSRKMAKRHGERKAGVAGLKERVNADFSAPQCPSTPPGLAPGTKAGYTTDTGNLCNGMSNNWQYSPYDFSDACDDIQSPCYDSCTGYSYEGCNALFYAAALFICSDEIGDEWWDVVSFAACDAQAAYFAGVAATSTGRNLYYTAQGNMCGCFCTNPSGTCLFPNGDASCVDFTSDPGNCGTCSRQCGLHLTCKNSDCACPNQQCNTTCTNFANSPNHCGGCDNVCPSGYCVNSACYTPSPDQCAPDQSVTNNMFDHYNTGTWANWTMAPYNGAKLGTNIILDYTQYYSSSGEVVYALGVEMDNLPAGGTHFALSQANVKMCPGFIYELTFAMGYVNVVNNGTVTSNADCTARWLTGPPSAWNVNDNFQTSPTYSIGASNPTYQTYPGWQFHVTEGDSGVTYTNPNLYIDLTAVVSCNTPTGATGHFVITDVELNQVGTVPPSPKRNVSLRQERDGGAFNNITEALQPYYSNQDEPLLMGYEPIKVKGRNVLAGGC
ncbi:hypothetical protein BX600DRAFT_438950 [Xylariales sp. PMI_506]|nr:hypothetical protein BX600DRAFT_438950 [Xylariales sp. PMI_506]